MTTDKPEPNPITVALVRETIITLGYDVVIVVARNVEQDITHVTTVGSDDPEGGDIYRDAAAAFGDHVKYELLGWDAKRETVHEDYRQQSVTS